MKFCVCSRRANCRRRIGHSKWRNKRVPRLTSSCQAQMYIAIPVMSGNPNPRRRNYRWLHTRCQLLITRRTDACARETMINRIDTLRESAQTATHMGCCMYIFENTLWASNSLGQILSKSGLSRQNNCAARTSSKRSKTKTQYLYFVLPRQIWNIIKYNKQKLCDIVKERLVCSKWLIDNTKLNFN